MFNQIKDLLQDAQLRQQIKKAASPAEAIKLIQRADAANDYNFTSESISSLMLMPQEGRPQELIEEDLLAVAGGFGKDKEAPSISGCC